MLMAPLKKIFSKTFCSKILVKAKVTFKFSNHKASLWTNFLRGLNFKVGECYEQKDTVTLSNPKVEPIQPVFEFNFPKLLLKIQLFCKITPDMVPWCRLIPVLELQDHPVKQVAHWNHKGPAHWRWSNLQSGARKVFGLSLSGTSSSLLMQACPYGKKMNWVLKLN